MKRLIAALGFAFALLAWHSAAHAACVTYSVNGQTCLQCCHFGVCTLTCS